MLESQHFLKQITDTTPNSIFLLELEDLKTIYINREIWASLGYLQEEFIAMGTTDLQELIHPQDQQQLKEYYRNFLNANDEEIREIEYRLKHKNGEWQWFLIRNAVFKRNDQGVPTQVIGIAQNITDRKQAEAELTRLNNKLEQIIQERTDEVENALSKINEKNEELKRINIDLDNFIYTASHDLRSPISNLEGLITILTKQLQGKIGSAEEDLVRMINISTNKLKNTIKDLTEITRAQKDMDEPIERVPFSEVLEDVQINLQGLIEEAEAEITTDFHVDSVDFARKSLRSVVYNLVSNAIKYRNPRRQVEVSLKTELRDNCVVLSVKDNGLGIPKDQQHKVFTMFKRVYTHVEGTGVGLYILKRIMENSGGKIELHSETGDGTTFEVYFPLIIASKQVQNT